jgi:hypothetical protein
MAVECVSFLLTSCRVGELLYRLCVTFRVSLLHNSPPNIPPLSPFVFAFLVALVQGRLLGHWRSER